MVVAFGALDLHPQEQLREVGRELLGLERGLVHHHRVEVRRSRRDVAARGGHHLRHELVERPARGELGVDPLLERVGRLHERALRRVAAADDPHLLAPDHRPQIDEFVAGEQLVDPAGALVGGGVGHERPVFVDRGWAGGEVERDAAEEGFVVTEAGGDDAEFLEPVEDEPVDEGVRRWIRPGKALGRWQHDHLGADREPAEPCEDVGVAGPLRRDAAVGIDLGHARVVREVTGQPRDVPRRAVGVDGRHPERLRRSRRLEHERGS
jgi:hypothetical protein